MKSSIELFSEAVCDQLVSSVASSPDLTCQAKRRFGKIRSTVVENPVAKGQLSSPLVPPSAGSEERERSKENMSRKVSANDVFFDCGYLEFGELEGSDCSCHLGL